MVAVITSLICAFLLLFNGIAHAGINYGSRLCHRDPDFKCHRVHRGESWHKLFPDDTERDVVMRINRMNTNLHSGLVIAIPNSISTNIMDYAPLPKQIEAPGEKLIYVSLERQAFGAYDASGSLQYWGPISAARGYCPDEERGCHTPTGHFEIQSKEGSGCYSTKFPVGRGGAPMPYCMFFHGGIALHGSYELPGYNDSHGCVRMNVKDARWLNEEFTADDYHAKVIVND